MLFNGEIILRAEHVSKRFQLGEFVGLVPALRALKRFSQQPWDYLRNRNKTHPHQRYEQDGNSRYLWALRDVNFELRRGERVAILGRNGAGKSTLLKILVGIMTPTEGKVESNCRIVPLMGVGAGFNPELTGRENVFIYAGLLGVPSEEIRAKYDEIVSFAEIPEFMETPVKRYSKGMRARLGMSVALNLSPEVLVVDEVLAVGDVPFRAKCMEKIEAICSDGVTLLFVSHSFARVKALCDRALLLRHGEIVANGDSHSVLNKYLAEDVEGGKSREANLDDESVSDDRNIYLPWTQWDVVSAPGDEFVKIIKLEITDINNARKQFFGVADAVKLNMEFIASGDIVNLYPRFNIYDEKKNMLFSIVWPDGSDGVFVDKPGMYSSSVVIPGNTLAPMTFLVGAGIFSYSPLEKHSITGEVVSFRYWRKDPCPQNVHKYYERLAVGYYQPRFEWNFSFCG